MRDALPWLAARPWIIAVWLGLTFVWIAGVCAWRARRILRSGKAILARVPENAVFSERWTSGSSDLSWFSRWGGAANVLLVALTPERLVVRLHCPFNLIATQSDLDHDVAVGEISSVSSSGSQVLVGVPGRVLRLRLRDPRRFLDAWSRLAKPC
jgi:hypothetical protein